MLDTNWGKWLQFWFNNVGKMLSDPFVDKCQKLCGWRKSILATTTTEVSGKIVRLALGTWVTKGEDISHKTFDLTAQFLHPQWQLTMVTDDKGNLPGTPRAEGETRQQVICLSIHCSCVVHQHNNIGKSWWQDSSCNSVILVNGKEELHYQDWFNQGIQ